MYLSQLEILGFKSFPEKTVLDFNGGITAVVGPNGCGKTNILDSIRWVLGEQRSSMLRSSKMEEVIFNGTAQMRPLGLAEVNLTIKNNRGVLPVEYDEVVITRRLYRSGESEYLLNKSQCRLKDIMELFYDTGMGPHAYSVIQQGMIDAILSDKAEDRRSLFEEAAGVTKYKHRKKEAIGKLEATRADLLRLGDIIGEIEKQVNQLRRQAAKARQFSRQKDELKQLEMVIASSLLYQLQDKHRELEERRGVLQADIAALIADYEKREINLQEARLKMTDLEHRAAAERQSQAEHTARAAEIEGEIKLNKHRVESATSEIVNSKTQIEALHGRIRSLQEGIEQNTRALGSLDEQKKTLASGSDGLETALADKARELAPCEAEVNEIRKRNASYAERISALKAEAASLSEMKENLEQKRQELKNDADSIDQTRSEKEDGLLALDIKRRKLESDIEELKANIQAISAEIIRIENHLAHKREAISKDKAEISGLKARQELLGQLIESGEGYSLGAKSLMAWADRPAGIMPPLAEVLEVPQDYRVAVAAALGNFSELIPAKSMAEAQAAIDFLKANDGGRASFLVMDKIELASLNSERPSGAPGFVGFLDELVTYPDDYSLAVNLLLGRVALFKTREEAISAGIDWNYYTRVDFEGFTVMPSALISGGKITSSVLGRHQDLNAVEHLIEEINAKLAESQADLDSNIRALQSQRDELASTEKAIRRLDDDKRKIESELGQMQFDFKERETRYTNAVSQARNIESEIAQFAQKLEKLEAELVDLIAQSQKGGEELSSSSARLLDLRNEVSRLEGKLTEARIKAIEHDSLASKLTSDISHGRELVAEAEKMIVASESAIEKADVLTKTSLAQNDELETSLYDIFAQRREVQTRLHEVEDSITEFMSEMGRIEDELSRHRKEKDRQTSSLHAIDLEFLEHESNRKSIIERLRMEFNISSLEPAPLPEGKTSDDLSRESQEIRSRLQRMDPVNLVAAEDYEREKDRLDFLIRQRDDLIDAENSLKEAIGRINITAETRFRETFAKIQEHFEKVFLSLFAGGEARVELEDDSAPLDSPIRILARPGGKRLLSVAQLSGGERALTAISLLFGIYLVKPSPFCILDEVDAPLDDANLMRFLKLIKDFAGTTQFIVITHNKMTMEASDILYGVTMETPGVSKVVSVKFADNGNGNGNGNGDKGKE